MADAGWGLPGSKDSAAGAKDVGFAARSPCFGFPHDAWVGYVPAAKQAKNLAEAYDAPADVIFHDAGKP